jgi:hypothetical protein
MRRWGEPATGRAGDATGRFAASYGIVLVLLSCFISGCRSSSSSSRPVAPSPHRPVATTRFADITEAAGIRFRHENGARGRRYLVETMGSGGAFLDFDGDGWLDLLLLNGMPLGGDDPRQRVPTNDQRPTTNDQRPTTNDQRLPSTSRLYRNQGQGTYADVTAGSGLDIPLYALGCCVGDYDNDGDEDVYVSCAVGSGRLFRNEGGGRFRDVTPQAGVGNQGRFGTSCAWLDYDNDGRLDLFIGNYVRYSLARDRPCYEGGRRYYCRPTVYPPDTCVLYRNRGDGKFEDVTVPAGIRNRTGNSLGVAVWDFDDDGWLDIAVANDLTPNYLFHNVPEEPTTDPGSGVLPSTEHRAPSTGAQRTARRFEEVGLEWGLAFGENAKARAGMGIDVAEWQNDGRPAVMISNFTGEPLSFFQYEGPEQFADIAFRVGVGEAHLRFLGFGLFFFDFDNDGDKDAFVGNGHIEPDIARFGGGVTYGQRKHLYENRGDETFAEIGKTLGAPFAIERVARGAAYGDIDNDGDLDILVTNNGQTAELLRNDGGNARSWLQLDLRGRSSNRSAIGARVTVRAGGVTQRDTVRSGSSYCSQSMLRLHFGLGAAAVADEVEVRWPGGTVERLRDVKANRRLTRVEGEGAP